MAEKTAPQDRAALRSLIGRLYEPQSVAIVGAGSDPNSMGGRALSVLAKRSYAGKLYPVNPRRTEMAGLPCYPTLEAIPGSVDVVELLVKVSDTIPTLEAAAAKGAHTAILLNAGFAEMGAEGAALEREMTAAARRVGIRLIGPNCGGIMNVRKDIPLGFLPAFSIMYYPVGSMALVSQSGGVLTNLLNKVHDRHIGLSFASSTGNEPDLTWVDFLDYVVHDEGTSAVAVYAESMADGEHLTAVADDALRLGKPIVLLKGGSSQAGQGAAASHTAALATSQRVLEAIARKYRMTLVDDVDDLIDITAYLATEHQCRTAQVVAVGTSGGMGVMTADALDHGGVPMAVISDATVARLKEALPPFAILRNPIDITGQYLNDPDLFKRVLGILGGAPEIGAILFSLAMVTEGYAERFADEIIEVSKSFRTPISVVWTGGSLTEGGVSRLREGGFAVFRRLGTAARGLRASLDFAVAHEQRVAAGAPAALPAPATVRVPAEGLSEHDAEALLASRGVPVARMGLAKSAAEAVKVADGIGYPVVCKVSSAAIQHKSEVGGVRLGLASGADVAKAFDELAAIAKRAGAGAPEVLVQEMATGGLEMIVGLQRDAAFGWLVLVGTGGIYAEVTQDVSLRPAPVSRAEAAEMIRELRGARILDGLRGKPPYDAAALAELVAKVSELPALFGDQDVQVDLNPVLVLERGKGVRAVDALITRPHTAR